jgi:hypothetical protein
MEGESGGEHSDMTLNYAMWLADCALIGAWFRAEGLGVVATLCCIGTMNLVWISLGAWG